LGLCILSLVVPLLAHGISWPNLFWPANHAAAEYDVRDFCAFAECDGQVNGCTPLANLAWIVSGPPETDAFSTVALDLAPSVPPPKSSALN
jgi:hypothetical protein